MQKIAFKISEWVFITALLSLMVFFSLGSGDVNTKLTHGNNLGSPLEGEILLMLNRDVSPNTVLSSMTNGVYFTMELISKDLNLWRAKYDESEVDSPEIILTSFLSIPGVRYAQFNHTVSLRENAPDDPRFDEQWSLKNTGQLGGIPNSDIKALKTWDYTTGGTTKDGREIVIAVIDNGFYLAHSDLTFRKNEDEIPGNKIDDDNNGYIDDYNGWNAVTNNDSIIPLDHGTRVTGVVGAKGNNNSGITGVNWKVGILPIQVKVFPEIDEATILKAYSYVLKQRQLYNQTQGERGAYIVAANSSFGIDFGRPEEHPLWCEFFDAMGKEGILNVAATMNNNSNIDVTGDIPTACSSNYLITVTSTTTRDELHNGSAYGPVSIDLGAPGISIISTAIGNQYSVSSGTSLAAPHVTGMIGLIYAAAHKSYINYGMSHPDSLALLFKRYILEGTEKLPTLNGKVSSNGRLNLLNPVIRVDRPMGSEGQIIPIVYSLSQNYPNPFNPSTNITYDVLDAVNVKIVIYNNLGQQISELVDSFHTKGRYSIQFDANSLPAGVYYYSLQSKYYSQVKKMILVK